MVTVHRITFTAVLAAFLGSARLGLSHSATTTSTDGVAARDGFGNPVDWFFVIKLPVGSFSPDEIASINEQGFDVSSLDLSDKHCACADPSCDDIAATPGNGEGRGVGLCYLYADSNNGTLSYFTDLGFDCLGQGGNDPVSQTMAQLYEGGRYEDPSFEWSFWNDQLGAAADSYEKDVCAYSSYSDESLPYTECSTDGDCGMRCGKSASNYIPCSSDDDCASGDTCKQISCTARDLPHYYSGCSSPYAHSKGALGFEKDGTGFFLQTTTPNYPDPSLGSTYAKLGCQLDNNARFAQSFFGSTLSASTMLDMAPALARARLCGAGTNTCKNGTAGHIVDFNCASEHTRGSDWSILDTAFSGTSTKEDSTSLSVTTAGAKPTALELVVKAEQNEVPPWLHVAHTLGADLAVASWVEGSYGSGSICAGDDYSGATNQMCLADDALALALDPSTGGASQSVENALAATFTINGTRRSWALWGDLTSDTASHAKYAVESSAVEPGASSAGYVVSGDMNQQGFPCSTSCSGSQNGRGGLFFGVQDAELQASVQDLFTMVCACDDRSGEYGRFCGLGCGWKDMTPHAPVQGAPNQQSSYWSEKGQSWTGPQCASGGDPSYDHQTIAYDSTTRAPAVATPSADGGITITPFFSPDNSASTLVGLIDNATATVDIMTPSASAWDYECSTFGDSGCAAGCSAESMRADPFPIFGALLNALHRGVAVRILTNDYNLPDCGGGNLTMLPFLALNGAEVRAFTTLAFVHAKFTQIDAGTSRAKTAVSSVNWSQSSYAKNREAGAVLGGAGAAALSAYASEVFEADWAQAYAMVNYTADFYDMDEPSLAALTDTSMVEVTVPDSPNAGSDGCFDVTGAFSATEVASDASVTLVANPDNAYEELTARFNASKSTIEVMMYQITDDMCGVMAERAQSGLNVSLLLSATIYDDCDCEAARACYETLSAAGATMRLTPRGCFNYAHQKFYMMDGESVGFSTGNLSPSDFNDQEVYPVYGADGWAKQNRDFTVWVDGDASAVAPFKEVFERDWAGGVDWSGGSNVHCG